MDTPGRLEDAYATRAEALRLLAVKPATLYTYVSRGWIRRIAGPGRRSSLYLREDVDRLRARSNARAASGILAGGAMRYGEPIVPTSITEITAGGPAYRTRGAVALAESGLAFEVVAELLWSGRLLEFRPWRAGRLAPAVRRIAERLGRCRTSAELHDAFALVTIGAGMASEGQVKGTTGEEAPVVAARQLILLLAGCFGLLAGKARYRVPRAGCSVAESIARALDARPDPDVVRLLDAALILSADHELNPATLVGRVAASSEAHLHRCVAAAICTNAGERIAYGCDRLAQILRHPAALRASGARTDGSPPRPDAALAFGFNHPLYPDGDPRGRCLLRMIRNHGGTGARLRGIFDYIDFMEARHRQHPRFELALAVLATALRLPAGAAGGLYTVGRVSGWVAHIAEQRLAGFLIRPRAKFIGAALE